MKKTYRTAMGKQLDIDSLRIANEETIAVGNMKVNARGDKLGPGGTVAETRNQTMTKVYGATVMQDAPQPVQTREELIAQQRRQGVRTTRAAVVSTPQEKPTVNENTETQSTEEIVPEEVEENTGPTLRGSLADSLAKSTTVNQELITPPSKRGPSGPSRI